LLTDTAFYEEVLIVEDELIDSYLSGELTESEGKQFESHFMLASERQQKLRFAKALQRYMVVAEPLPQYSDVVDEGYSEGPVELVEPPPKKAPVVSFLPFKNPIVSYSLLAAVVLIVAGVTWGIFRNLRNPSTREPTNVMAVVLMPGLIRDNSGGIKKITVPPGTDTLRLRLALATDEYPGYSAQAQTTEGRTIHSANDLKTETADGHRVVNLDLPAELVSVGDYKIKLNGIGANGSVEPIASYYVRVSPR
jgi:hypothetical protein